ncbi:MAG: RNA polymerase sigma-70 factor [Prevotellaceae bacterium]|jgi:RNA polymerase sigma-70 factor (ECF subfamily)|nr:RNA polymerase sigma-70 factor [Prevotellaceae bacterium]
MTPPPLKKELMRISLHDSADAFRVFYDKTHDRMFRTAYYYTRHEAWAQDVVIDVYAKLWEQRARLAEVTDIYDYCFILTKNTSLNYISKEERRAAPSLDSLPEPASDERSPEEQLIDEELMSRYLSAVDSLPERCREVFVRIREAGDSYAEVAAALHISTKTVDAQLQKATKRLREALDRYDCR